MNAANPASASNPGSIRIAIADGHALFRESLRRLLDAQPDFEVVGEAADGVATAQMVHAARPHVLLLEIDMPQRSGLETLRALGGPRAPTRALLLVSSIRRDELVEALCVGAYGLVVKSSASQTLFKGIRTVVAGQYWIDRASIGELIQALRQRQRSEKREPRAAGFGLTGRELEIVSAIVGGSSNRDVAERLGVGEVTIKHHLSSIFRKLQVSNRLELALFAVNNRLASRNASGKRHSARTAPA